MKTLIAFLLFVPIISFSQGKQRELKEVVINPEKENLVNLGPLKTGSQHYFFYRDTSRVYEPSWNFIIENPYKISKKIAQIRYHMPAQKFPKAPFRVRLYKLTEDGQIGELIEDADVTISGSKGMKWNIVNLRSRFISLPANGLVLLCTIPEENCRKFYRDNDHVFLDGSMARYVYPFFSRSKTKQKTLGMRYKGAKYEIFEQEVPAIGITVIE